MSNRHLFIYFRLLDHIPGRTVIASLIEKHLVLHFILTRLDATLLNLLIIIFTYFHWKIALEKTAQLSHELCVL